MKSLFRFRSFHARLTFFLISLLVMVLTITLIAVNYVTIANTRQEIEKSLAISSDVFKNQLNDSIQKLFEIARLLSSDYAFKSAYSTHDHDTILSAMENHLARIDGSNIMILVGLDGRIIASTIQPGSRGQANSWSQLQNRAEQDEYGEATSLLLVKDKFYQMMVVPLLIPDLDAWIYIGFPINDALMQKIKGITHTDVSLVEYKQQQWTIIASTLNANIENEIAPLLLANNMQSKKTFTLPSTDQLVSHAIAMPLSDSPDQAFTLLQRSLDQALQPYQKLRTLLFSLFSISLFSSILLAFFLARKVTRPVSLLTESARRIEHGDYNQHIDIDLHDEIGQLAHSFNSMALGLAEKEKVRNLLGKVISPQIADELLRKEIELGGEERFVTTLFSDVRNFTSLCEGREPKEILSLLNEYLTEVSQVIEQHGGVVDKYIGDAVMALFGAPLQHHDDAFRAVDTAFGMIQALHSLNEQFQQRGLPTLGIGIGINSDIVVAGNMGSPSRLNYTVIGDGVNLASRLEGLTRVYGVEIVVSESTAHAAPEYLYRELDLVRVKGKQTPCTIYQPMGRKESVPDYVLDTIHLYHSALKQYRHKNWQEALDLFSKLHDVHPNDKLFSIYYERSQQYLEAPPASDWDGVHVHQQK